MSRRRRVALAIALAAALSIFVARGCRDAGHVIEAQAPIQHAAATLDGRAQPDGAAALLRYQSTKRLMPSATGNWGL